MALLDDFNAFVSDFSGSSPYKTWAKGNPGELAKWQAVVSAITAGQRPTLPTLSTHFGSGLIDEARLFLDATAPAPAPVPRPGLAGYPKQGISVPLYALAPSLDRIFGLCKEAANGHPFGVRTDWWPDDPNWNGLIAKADSYGLTMLALLNYARSKAPSVADFAAQAAQIAPLVKFLNIHNEPNLNGWTAKDAAAYATAAYDAAHKANPSIVVLGPDVAANAGGGFTPASALQWCKDFKAAGGKVDIAAGNFYNDAVNLDANWNLWAEAAAIRQVFGGIPLVSLEGGCNADQASYGTPWGTLTGAQYQDKSVQTGLDARARGLIDAFNVYSMLNDAEPGGFGLLDSSGAKRPAFASLQSRALA